jgi:hypothetical protein
LTKTSLMGPRGASRWRGAKGFDWPTMSCSRLGAIGFWLCRGQSRLARGDAVAGGPARRWRGARFVGRVEHLRRLDPEGGAVERKDGPAGRAKLDSHPSARWRGSQPASSGSASIKVVRHLPLPTPQTFDVTSPLLSFPSQGFLDGVSTAMESSAWPRTGALDSHGISDGPRIQLRSLCRCRG